MEIRFLEIAQIELDEAIEYYNSESSALGDSFLSKYSRIPPSSAGGINGLPSPLGGVGLGEGEMI